MPNFLETLPLDQQIQIALFVERQVKNIPDDINPKYVQRTYHRFTDDEIRNKPFDLAPISCRRGCCHCCYLHVDVSQPEADILLQHVKPEDVDVLERQSHYNAETWEEQPHEQKKCIFLKNSECSVYDDRPMSCRKYFVVSPSEDCDTKDGKLGKQVQVASYAMAEIYTAITMNRYGYGTLPNLLYNKLNQINGSCTDTKTGSRSNNTESPDGG